jgi:predicted amidohydrolase
VRAAAVQLQSTNDRDRNLDAADRLTRAAAADGAEFVVLPERLDLRGSAQDYSTGAETLEDGRPLEWASQTARELGIDLVAGSIAERREGHDRVANTSIHVGPDGELKAVYRKIHMFDVEVGGVEYRESEHSEPADEIVLSEAANGTKLGLTVCASPSSTGSSPSTALASSPCPPTSPASPARPTGRCCCARGRLRIRSS